MRVQLLTERKDFPDLRQMLASCEEVEWVTANLVIRMGTEHIPDDTDVHHRELLRYRLLERLQHMRNSSQATTNDGLLSMYDRSALPAETPLCAFRYLTAPKPHFLASPDSSDKLELTLVYNGQVMFRCFSHVDFRAVESHLARMRRAAQAHIDCVSMEAALKPFEAWGGNGAGSVSALRDGDGDLGYSPTYNLHSECEDDIAGLSLMIATAPLLRAV